METILATLLRSRRNREAPTLVRHTSSIGWESDRQFPGAQLSHGRVLAGGLPEIKHSTDAEPKDAAEKRKAPGHTLGVIRQAPGFRSKLQPVPCQIVSVGIEDVLVIAARTMKAHETDNHPVNSSTRNSGKEYPQQSFGRFEHFSWIVAEMDKYEQKVKELQQVESEYADQKAVERAEIPSHGRRGIEQRKASDSRNIRREVDTKYYRKKSLKFVHRSERRLRRGS